jgi:hypothetical protein
MTDEQQRTLDWLIAERERIERALLDLDLRISALMEIDRSTRTTATRSTATSFRCSRDRVK